MGRIAAALTKNTAFTSVRWLLTLPLSLATSVLFARYLGPVDFGTYRLVTMIAFGLEVLANPALSQVVTRFVAEQEDQGRAGPVMPFFLRTTGALYALAALPFLALVPWLAAFYRDPGLAPLFLIAAAGVLPSTVLAVLSAGLRGQQRFAAVNALAAGRAALNLAGLGVVFWLGGRVASVFVLLLVLNVVGAAAAYLCLARDLPLAALARPAPRELARRMRRYAVVVGGVSVVGLVVWDRSEVFFLGRFAAREEVGYYSLAFTLALEARRFLPSAFGEALFPALSRLAGLRDEWGIGNAFVQATRYLAIIGLPLAVGGAVVARPIIALLFGAAYLPAAPVLVILFVSAGVVSLSHAAASVILVKEQYRFLVASSVALAVVNVALDLLLIPRWAAVGAAVANTLVQVAGVGVQLAFVVRLLRAPLPLGNLARCLAATLLAWAPAAALAAWLPLPALPALALRLLSFVVVYPVALALAGALVPEDFARARALVERLPAALGRHARAVTAGLEGLAGRGAPGFAR
jgi:O-antigen/teichoic acid export membrane protein